MSLLKVPFSFFVAFPVAGLEVGLATWLVFGLRFDLETSLGWQLAPYFLALSCPRAAGGQNFTLPLSRGLLASIRSEAVIGTILTQGRPRERALTETDPLILTMQAHTRNGEESIPPDGPPTTTDTTGPAGGLPSWESWRELFLTIFAGATVVTVPAVAVIGIGLFLSHRPLLIAGGILLIVASLVWLAAYLVLMWWILTVGPPVVWRWILASVDFLLRVTVPRWSK